MSNISTLLKESKIIQDKLFKEEIICSVCGEKAIVLNGLKTCDKMSCFNIWWDEQSAIAQSKKAEYDNVYQKFLSKKR